MNFIKLLFTTDGRINRKEWWLGNIIAFIAVKLVIFITHISIPLHLSISMFSIHNLTIGLLLGLLYFYIHVCLNVKRWHDHNQPGYYVLLGYVPLLGLIINIIALGIMKGDDEANEYGEKT